MNIFCVVLSADIALMLDHLFIYVISYKFGAITYNFDVWRWFCARRHIGHNSSLTIQIINPIYRQWAIPSSHATIAADGTSISPPPYSIFQPRKMVPGMRDSTSRLGLGKLPSARMRVGPPTPRSAGNRGPLRANYAGPLSAPESRLRIPRFWPFLAIQATGRKWGEKSWIHSRD